MLPWSTCPEPSYAFSALQSVLRLAQWLKPPSGTRCDEIVPYCRSRNSGDSQTYTFAVGNLFCLHCFIATHISHGKVVIRSVGNSTRTHFGILGDVRTDPKTPPCRWHLQFEHAIDKIFRFVKHNSPTGLGHFSGSYSAILSGYLRSNRHLRSEISPVRIALSPHRFYKAK